MKHENRFLIRYGLHNVVHHLTEGDRSIFVIHDQTNPKLVGHAKSIISNTFGNSADILVP